MTYQIITLKNSYITLYNDNICKKYDWYDMDLLSDIEQKKMVYLVYLEKIEYHKRTFLNNLEVNNIDYEVVPKGNLLIKKYIYDYWHIRKEEVLDINKIGLYILLDLKNNDLSISIYELINRERKLEVNNLYEDYVYIKDKTNNEYYYFLDILSHIQRLMKKDYIRNKPISKIILIGKELKSESAKSFFEDKYSEDLIDTLNYDIPHFFSLYLDIQNDRILDPFNKSQLQYFSKDMILNECDNGMAIVRSIKIVNRYERLPIDKTIVISPTTSIESKQIFSIEKGSCIYKKEISFPFIYNFDEVSFNLRIESENIAKIKVYVNDNIIDTWNIDWRKKDEFQKW